MTWFIRVLAFVAITLPAAAQDGPVRLAAPEALVASGVLSHILPRFSLKTQVRVEVVAEDAPADARFGAEGRAVFAGPERVWHLDLTGAHDGAGRLLDWLTSEVGRTTVASYAPDGTAPFVPAEDTVAFVADAAPEGDAVLGLEVSRVTCARCHAVEAGGRMNAIGSSPSFAVLRARADWLRRFEAFYARAPHASFTQVAEVTAPFDPARPPPLAPIEITLDELDAVIAYVAALPAAELGAPLRHQ